MVERLDTRCIVRPDDLTPTRPDFEVVGAFNPGAVEFDDGSVLVLVRVAEAVAEKRDGAIGLPRWDMDRGDIVVDWAETEAVDQYDPRAVIFRQTQYKRLTFISHLLALRSTDGRTFESFDGVRIMPQTPYETFGLEDPRITRIGERFYITYVAVSPHGVTTALMSTTDWRSFERHGIIFTRENKDVVLFPEKVGGAYAAIHRPTGAFVVAPAEMWYATSPDLVHWGRHTPLWGSRFAWDGGRIGGGCPPIRIDRGWLKVYHGSAKPQGAPVGVYSAGAIVLDHDDPTQVIGYTPEAILKPEADFEREGFVNNVVFPTGIVQREDKLWLYCGASDTYVGFVEVGLGDVLDAVTWV